MRKKVSILLVLILAASLIFSACSNGGKGDKLVIGVLTPTSGPEAYYGNDMYLSYQLAVKEINDAGGVLGKQLELYHADDGCDVNMASQAATKIVSAGVDFVVGGYCSGATIPVLPLFADEKLVTLISAANSTDITKLGLPSAFMINSPGTHQARSLGSLCKSLGSQKVALIHQGDAYTQNLADLVTGVASEFGFSIVATEVMEKGAADVSAIVTAVRNAGADMVYWCGYFADGSNVIKQLRQGGYTGEICVGDGSSSTELITGSGPAGEGVYVTSPPYVEFSEGGAKFREDFKKMHNVEPGAYATLCYDTIYVLKNAIEKAGSTDFQKVRDAVQAIDYPGLSGRIKFTADRELEFSNFIILQINNGAFKLVTP